MKECMKLFSNEVNEITVTGIVLENNKNKEIVKKITKDDFIPRHDNYYLIISIMAERVFEEIRKPGPCIVNGIIRVSRRTGNVYISCRYNDIYFQEGILPCPEEDADMENLILIPEESSESPLTDFALKKEHPEPVPELPRRRGRRRRKPEQPTGQQNFADYLERVDGVK